MNSAFTPRERFCCAKMKETDCVAQNAAKHLESGGHFWIPGTGALCLWNGLPDQVCYYGAPDGVVPHFASLGLHCAPLYNPADFLCE